MIFAVSMLFLFMGLFFMICDWFYPASTVLQLANIYSLTFPIRIMGVMFFIIGVMVLAVRIVPSGLSMFMDLPNSKLVPLIHSRVKDRDPDAKFMKGRRVDLEIIRAPNKTFKDAGGGFRIMGHSCRRTYETIGFTVPDWLSEYFHRIREKYNIKDSDEWRELKKKLKELDENKTVTQEITIDGKKETYEKKLSKEEQLKNIECLQSVMNDPYKKKVLLDMDWDELRQLEELLFDGKTHNGDDVELFIDSATPNEQDVLERQTFVNELERHNRYKDPGEINFGKWVPYIIIMILVSTVCAIMLQGAFGGG